MAKVHGIAGEWARVKGTVLGLWALFASIFFFGFGFAWWIFAGSGCGAALTALALCAIGYAAFRGVRRVERFFKGARGEEKVAGILKRLPEGYHVFNDFLAGRTHVDHVVVGPAGVFAVETKCWAGEVTIEEGHVLVNGRLPSRSPLAQVLREASLVKAALAERGWKGPVTPVVAFASDNFNAHSAEVGGAFVINSDELQGAFAGSRATIPAVELERLVSLMEG